MGSEIVHFPQPKQETRPSDARVRGALAILRAIEAGELLAALPDCSVAKQQHLLALELLSIAERELMGFFEGLVSEVDNCAAH